MEIIRPLLSSDIPSVANLFLKTFRQTNTPASQILLSYFDELYLNNPWQNKKINSLVYEHNGEVAGFLGAIPFPLIFRGKAVQAVIGGNYMINPEHPNPLAGVKILKTLFAGPQDITYSDTATDTARKIWEGLGSSSLYLYSLQWLKIINPVQFTTMMGTRNTVLSPIAQIVKPLSTFIDASIQKFPKSPFFIEKTPLNSGNFSISALLKGISTFTSRTDLTPAYTEQSLEWLIRKAEEKKEFGPLKKVILFNSEEKLAGWYLYYPNRGKLGQVLQLGVRRHSVNAVLRHLFLDAQLEGSLALMGRIIPEFIPEFSSHQCLITHRNSSLVAHSKNKEILNTLHNGKAFFSRLEGEWWTRLQGDTFAED